jgi:signal transduction histidine kinase/CheY-like chemotaxis protein
MTEDHDTAALGSVQHLRKLQALTAALASAPRMREVADIVVREARTLFAADAAVLAVGETGDRLRILSTDHLPTEIADRYIELDAESSMPIAIAYRTGELFVAETAASLQAQSPDTAAASAVMRARAAICARIPGEHGVRGAIGFAFDHERAFRPEDRQFLLDVANLASLALARARLFESESEARKSAETALVRAQLADRRKDEFLAMLGHELRNPLAPIVTALELMKLDGIGEQRLRDVIERQVTHMTRLIDDLLDVSRITRGRIELARAPLDLAEILGKAIEQASPLLERNAHRLSFDQRDTGLRVLGDPTRLAQVFANLMNNAAKYSPAGSQILVTARRDGERVAVTVRDHGIGIAPELLPHVFDVFMQAPQAIARSQGGLGLGLAIVKQLVEMHGGEVAAKSAGPGHGSEFEVRLPLLQHTSPMIVEQPTRAAPRTQASLQVLVVDDNQDAAEMLAEMLASAGHRTHVAYDGPSALQAAVKAPPDVALIDIGLPVMDGYELCRRFAGLPRPPRLMVAITGYGQPGDTIRAREAGFHDHLVKPVDVDRIVRSIATIR